jgi:nitroreductase
MEHFSDLVKKRRSHRKFTDEPILESQIQTLLDTALMSPTSKGLHSCKFYVVESKELLGRLALSKAVGSQFVCDANCAIVVVAEPEISDVWIEDASAAAMSILYQAEDLGLGACWVQIRERQDAEGVDSSSIVSEILGLSALQSPVCLIALGHKGMERKEQNYERIEALKQEKVVRL